MFFFLFFKFLQLQKADPKPENPLKFIHHGLSNSIDDNEEIVLLKDSVAKLVDNVGQIKADIAELTNIVSKLVSDKPAEHIEMTLDVPMPSMKNVDAADCSDITFLDDSSLIFDESPVNDDDLNSTIEIDDEPKLNYCDSNAQQTKETPNDCAVGYTMEFVEVDVVNKSAISFDLTPVSQHDETIDEMHVDDMPSEQLTITSTPEKIKMENDVDVTHDIEKMSNTNMQIEELPIVFRDDFDEM